MILIYNKSNMVKIKGCLLSALMILFILQGCKKEVEELLPGPEDSGVNFYNASEVMNSQRALRKDNMIYINDSIPNDIFKTYPSYDEVFVEKADLRQYPKYPWNHQGLISDRYQYVYYMPLAVGNYNFIYTGPNKVYLKDTQIHLAQRDELQSFYLVESPEADNAYKIVTVPEEREESPGQVRVRIINLSTDAGPLTIKRVDQAGNETSTVLPINLAFGEYSDYANLDTAGTSQTSRGIILKVYSQANLSQQISAAVIPAEANGSFVLLIQGFRKPVARRIPTGYNGDGSLRYETVNIEANFRTNLRRTY